MRIRRILGLGLSLAKGEFKLKNEGSYLGIFWYLLNPLLMFTLLILVFSNRLGGDIPSYPVYLLLGIVIFNLFQQATTESTKILFNHDGIIKSINFPYESLIISVILKTFFSHILEIVMVIGFLIFFKVPIYGMVLYPVFLLFFGAFITGVSLILSSFTIYLRDLENIWIFVSRLLFFATPIFYAVGGQTKLFIFNLFNPLYYFITIARDLVIYLRIPPLWMISGMVIYSLLSLVIGSVIFAALKKKIAELI